MSVQDGERLLGGTTQRQADGCWELNNDTSMRYMSSRGMPDIALAQREAPSGGNAEADEVPGKRGAPEGGRRRARHQLHGLAVRLALAHEEHRERGAQHRARHRQAQHQQQIACAAPTTRMSTATNLALSRMSTQSVQACQSMTYKNDNKKRVV